MSKKKSTGQEIYNGVSSFGAVMSDIKAIMATIFGLIMIAIGIVMIIHKTRLKGPVQGVIKNIDDNFGNIDNICTLTGANVEDNKADTFNYNCNFKVVYKNPIDGKEYSQNFMNQVDTRNLNQSPKYILNASINVWYDPNNPSDFYLFSDDTNAAGWILLVVGIITIIVGWVWSYFANKYKIIGAVEGVSSGIDIVRNF